ncbi:MAG: hypothetical protein PWQ61_3391, partial [Betaproteobacteria bacterium]|nr:hypothetical protein [Betaproteobacteria bacterium]
MSGDADYNSRSLILHFGGSHGS